MAENSRRELILCALKDELASIPSIRQVVRQMPQMDEMDTIPATSLPMIAMTAGLPAPVQKGSSRRAGANSADYFLSELTVNIFVYAIGKVEPDTILSNLADDLWAKLNSIDTLGKLIIEVRVNPEMPVGIWDPYVVFKMVVTFTYAHGTGGI